MSTERQPEFRRSALSSFAIAEIERILARDVNSLVSAKVLAARAELDQAGFKPVEFAADECLMSRRWLCCVRGIDFQLPEAFLGTEDLAAIARLDDDGGACT